MQKRAVLLLLIATACASAPKEPTGSGMVELTISRPRSGSWMFRTPSIEVNGVKAGDLPNGESFVTRVPPGQVTIATSLWDMPGTSKLTFTAKPKGKYHIQISPNDSKVDAGVVGAVVGGGAGAFIGMAAAEPIASNNGPFMIELEKN